MRPEVCPHTSSLLQPHTESCMPSCTPTYAHLTPYFTSTCFHSQTCSRRCTCALAHLGHTCSECVVMKSELAAVHGQGHCSSLSPRDVLSLAWWCVTPIRNTHTCTLSYAAQHPRSPRLSATSRVCKWEGQERVFFPRTQRSSEKSQLALPLPWE